MQVIVVYDGPICLKAKQTMKFQNVINIYMMISNISIRPWIQHKSNQSTFLRTQIRLLHPFNLYYSIFNIDVSQQLFKYTGRN